MQDGMETDKRPARGERRDVSLRAFALRKDGSSVDVTLLDLSYDGCLLGSSETFAIGERLRLLVRRRGIIDAQVRWLDGGKVGVRFEEDMAA